MSRIVMYHSTTEEAVEVIMRDGFRSFPRHPFNTDGVFLARVSFTVNDGAKGEDTIEVVLDITEEELSQYAIIEDETWDDVLGEWIKDESFEPYEWLVPIDVVNRAARRLLSDEESLGPEGSRPILKVGHDRLFAHVRKTSP